MCAVRGRMGRETSLSDTAETSHTAFFSTSSGIPISFTMRLPVYRQPGSEKCPGYARENVTVTSALTASPSTSPVSARTPEAMSAATTGAGESFISFTASRAFPRSAE